MNSPLLWYLNRATGVVLLVMFTVSLVLGVLAAGGRPGRGVPRFVTQSLHRNVAFLSVLALGVHVVAAVADTYVDIRWWQALVPFGATYKPVWLALGALALDVLVVVVVTSMIRVRLGVRAWRAIHLLVWVAWGVSVAHAIGLGTDLTGLRQPATGVVAGCLAAVVAALAVRLVRTMRARRSLAGRRPA
jgi:sulfoxide reductase heme-binding subunit YedZ